MIDIVAKAIFNKMARDVRGQRRYWETAPVEARELCRDLARAAIEAMRNVPDDILLAGWVDRFPDGERLTADRWRENWAGVIDAAIGESK